MTVIDNDATRDDLISVIYGLEAGGGTCLGNAVLQGLEVLSIQRASIQLFNKSSLDRLLVKSLRQAV